MRLKKSLVLPYLFLFCATGIFLSAGCDQPDKRGEQARNDGKSLSLKYCQSCHEYPDARFLDKETWAKHVLPAMAPRLGIQVYAEDQYVNNPSAKTMLSYDDWLKIVDYYTKAAPKALKAARQPIKPLKDWGVFSLKKPTGYKPGVATTTMVAFDAIGHQIYTSDRTNSSVYQWSNNLAQLSVHKYSSPAVDVQFMKDAGNKEHGLFTFIGSMDAVDVLNGYVKDISINQNGVWQDAEIANGLPRPVQSLTADFDKDGLADVVVCGFGHNAGGLYLLKQLPGHKFEKRVISTIPGAEHAIIGDFDHDGWPDIACLFAQADEGIWLFLNDHKGGFKTSNLLRFPPFYGSSSFQLVDFNNDGKLDILYTSGDNSDYSRILKPYHGVYIFINQGDFKYKKAWFFPVNGATKAIAADFNGDGLPDIALIAFFSDLKNNPAEGFTYFEQNGPLHFMPHNLPIENEGRWICMDVGDYNADGKPDILLGNYSMGFINQEGVKPQWDSATPFVLLTNTGSRHQ
ncbi:VCBS repeat-containing protein [Mucilaginibacter sp.]|uniref:FG-GAP repeat domain-containing protein n=1 Tax=Mucilaginibacter sp. TaxID=1882438 RepID=UPI002ED223B3